ncbi:MULTISPECIES: D-glucuronyl C5-epimerase family protein [Halolamina]|uniref:D-glucuronyl C5-epimerase C-terminus n=1 Tax=Halolamina pelagica TaxID=699431 RepID=A0A1I5U2D6_9EURY|nr:MULTISPECIES: D-glucuronyl C5-epimerase family protein [Halolamina]NHX36762.1 hypothetical protein [Halolamina sp. R1-12]SFP89443.1 D-glucuronyl C5-epimerase C-terminus [Halolamina pelagica]
MWNDLSRRRVLATAGAALIGGCSAIKAPTSEETPSNPSVSIDGEQANHEKQEINNVGFENRPQWWVNAFKWPYESETDGCVAGSLDSIPNLEMGRLGDDRGHHALRTATNLLQVLSCYRRTDHPAFLEKAKTISDQFIAISVGTDDGIYFPYTMEYKNLDRTFRAPWFSGLAQGKALSAYVDLYRATQDNYYFTLADNVFSTFTNLYKETEQPWICTVEDGFYWIEEYPSKPSSHVLNGFNMGLWGVYDYWMLTDSERAREVLECGLLTMSEKMSEYRNVGGRSYYSLDPAVETSEFYHRLHVRQFEELGKICDGNGFSEFADELRRDFWKEEWNDD